MNTHDSQPKQGLGDHCAKCRYIIDATHGDRCPECGYDLGYLQITEPQLPWPRYRGVIGPYVRTVYVSLFRPRRLIEELVRDIDYRQASRFRWLTLFLVCLAIVVISYQILQSTWFIETAPIDTSLGMNIHDKYWQCAGLAVAAVIFMTMMLTATRLNAELFARPHLRPQEQGKVMALSYYTMSALALFPLTIALAIVCFANVPSISQSDVVAGILISIGVILLIVPSVVYLTLQSYLAKHILIREESRSWFCAKIIMVWSLSKIGVGLILPAILAYITVIIISLL